MKPLCLVHAQMINYEYVLLQLYLFFDLEMNSMDILFIIALYLAHHMAGLRILALQSRQRPNAAKNNTVHGQYVSSAGKAQGASLKVIAL